jgi:hypothetical protein
VPDGNRPISVYRLGEMPIQSCGQSVGAPRGKAGARLNAHTELRAKRQRSAREAIYRNRPIARHLIGCRLTYETRAHSALDDVASNIWQAVIARHFIGCRSTDGTRVHNAWDDLVSNICQALPPRLRPIPPSVWRRRRRQRSRRRRRRRRRRTRRCRRCSSRRWPAARRHWRTRGELP